MGMREVLSTAEMIPVDKDTWLLRAEAEGMKVEVDVPHAILEAIQRTLSATANVSGPPESYNNGNLQRFLASMIAACIEVHIQKLELFFVDQQVSH